MAIVSSNFVLGAVQKDGRVWVVESHTDNIGFVHQFEFLAMPEDNHSVVMEARALTLDEQLRQTEIVRMLNDLSPPIMIYGTKAALLLRWREAFRNASRARAAEMAAWLLNHLDAGHWTDAQLRTLFGDTAAEYSARKSRLEAMRTKWNDISAVAGE